MDEERLTPAEVQLVLRRAAELERRAPGDEALTPAEVTGLAAEAGLSPDAVRRALDEVRVGALAPPEPPRALERVLGPTTVVAERTLPGDPAAVQRRLEWLLRGQLLRKRRDLGARTIWEHAQGWLPQLRRSLDWSGTLVLRDAHTVEATVLDAGAGRVTVRLGADVGALQRRVIGGTALGAAGGLGAAVALWAMGTPEVLEWLVAAGAVATGAIASLRGYRRGVGSTTDALEHLLDRVER